MIRIIALLSLSVFALAAVPQAQAAPIVFRADLLGANEVPPVATTGTGTGIVTFDQVAHTMRVQVTFEDLISPSTVAHIHAPRNPATGLGGVATTVPTFPGFPAGVLEGSYDETFDTLDLATYNPVFVTNNGGSAASAETALLNFMLDGLAYLNVHSSQFGGGEIRGDLLKVPEPASLGLLMLGFGIAGMSLARRRR